MKKRRSGPAPAADAPAEAPQPRTADGVEGPEGPGFEDGIARLESIVDRLEDGDLALEEALQAFEQGVGLARALAERLTRAEQRVEVLLREGDETRVRPLDAIPDDDADATSGADGEGEA